MIVLRRREFALRVEYMFAKGSFSVRQVYTLDPPNAEL